MVEILQAHEPTPDVLALLGELDAFLAEEYPPEQRHGLKLEAVFQPDVKFYIARLNGAPAGCGAIRLANNFAEIKRMYVRPEARGRGVAPALLNHFAAAARALGLAWLRLETGIRQPAAIRCYEREGFTVCPPFPPYTEMTQYQTASSLFYERPV